MPSVAAGSVLVVGSLLPVGDEGVVVWVVGFVPLPSSGTAGVHAVKNEESKSTMTNKLAKTFLICFSPFLHLLLVDGFRRSPEPVLSIGMLISSHTSPGHIGFGRSFSFQVANRTAPHSVRNLHLKL